MMTPQTPVVLSAKLDSTPAAPAPNADRSLSGDTATIAGSTGPPPDNAAPPESTPQPEPEAAKQATAPLLLDLDRVIKKNSNK